YGVIPKAAIAKQAIPRCNLTFVKGAEMKTQLAGYLQVLFGYNPAAIGGAMPADDFYYAG
ncbi:MAG: ABC transporter substrate-binding protein, partial [Clostridia bacterium]|nr:ABC transporter substrate-binding protein [Clostridia bacterium]